MRANTSFDNWGHVSLVVGILMIIFGLSGRDETAAWGAGLVVLASALYGCGKLLTWWRSRNRET